MLFNPTNMSLIFSCDSEACPSESQENLKDMFLGQESTIESIAANLNCRLSFLSPFLSPYIVFRSRSLYFRSLILYIESITWESLFPVNTVRDVIPALANTNKPYRNPTVYTYRFTT